eukprot:ctg_325.g88
MTPTPRIRTERGEEQQHAPLQMGNVQELVDGDETESEPALIGKVVQDEVAALEAVRWVLYADEAGSHAVQLRRFAQRGALLGRLGGLVRSGHGIRFGIRDVRIDHHFHGPQRGAQLMHQQRHHQRPGDEPHRPSDPLGPTAAPVPPTLLGTDTHHPHPRQGTAAAAAAAAAATGACCRWHRPPRTAARARRQRRADLLPTRPDNQRTYGARPGAPFRLSARCSPPPIRRHVHRDEDPPRVPHALKEKWETGIRDEIVRKGNARFAGRSSRPAGVGSSHRPPRKHTPATRAHVFPLAAPVTAEHSPPTPVAVAGQPVTGLIHQGYGRGKRGGAPQGAPTDAPAAQSARQVVARHAQPLRIGAGQHPHTEEAQARRADPAVPLAYRARRLRAGHRRAACGHWQARPHPRGGAQE